MSLNDHLAQLGKTLLLSLTALLFCFIAFELVFQGIDSDPHEMDSLDQCFLAISIGVALIIVFLCIKPSSKEKNHD